jgi:hypothetical protein
MRIIGGASKYYRTITNDWDLSFAGRPLMVHPPYSTLAKGAAAFHKIGGKIGCVVSQPAGLASAIEDTMALWKCRPRPLESLPMRPATMPTTIRTAKERMSYGSCDSLGNTSAASSGSEHGIYSLVRQATKWPLIRHLDLCSR